MSAISTILTRLRAAIWAIDVRDDIANAIEQCYSDVSNPTLRTEALEAALQNKIDQGKMAALTIGDHTITAAKLAQGVIDNTLATSGAAADAKKTGDELTAIKADLDAQTGVISLIKDYYIRTSDTPISLVPISSTVGRMYAVVDCAAGDKFVINAYSDFRDARTWCFIDSSNNAISMSDANAVVTDLELTAPENAVKLIINDKNGGMSYKVGNNLATKASNGLSDEAKEAILACFRNVPWIDGGSCFANLEAVFGVVRYEWTYPSQNVIMLHAGANPNMNDVLSRATLADSEYRRTIVYTYGEAPYYYNGEASNYYPIPVPADATKVKVEMSPSNEYVYMHMVRLNGSAYGDSIVDNRVTWTQLTNGVLEKTITNPGNLFLMLNIKYDNSNSAFPSDPSRVKITFIKGE